MHPGLGGDLGELVALGTGDAHGAAPVLREELAAAGEPHADRRPEVDALGVAADERLGEDDEAGTLAAASPTSLRTIGIVAAPSKGTGAS